MGLFESLLLSRSKLARGSKSKKKKTRKQKTREPDKEETEKKEVKEKTKKKQRETLTNEQKCPCLGGCLFSFQKQKETKNNTKKQTKTNKKGLGPSELVLC